MLVACSVAARLPFTATKTGVDAAPGVAATPVATVAPAVPAAERQWAVQALQILDTVDAAVDQYHASTEVPARSAQARQLRQQAYDGFGQALVAHQQLLPQTQALEDAAVRDQFMFLMGNVGGFLNPTPDLVGDPPTLGDRIARSLQNAVSTGAALRPTLVRLVGQQ